MNYTKKLLQRGKIEGATTIDGKFLDTRQPYQRVNGVTVETYGLGFEAWDAQTKQNYRR